MPGVEDEEAGEGDLELAHRDAEEVQDAGREHLTGHLGRRRHVPEVVDQADGEDDAAGRGRRPSSSVVSMKIGCSAGTGGGATSMATASPRTWRPPAVGGGSSAPTGRRASPRSPPCGDAPSRDGQSSAVGGRQRRQDQCVPADVGHAATPVEVGVGRERLAQRARPRRAPRPARASSVAGRSVRAIRAAIVAISAVPCPPSSRPRCRGAAPRSRRARGGRRGSGCG